MQYLYAAQLYGISVKLTLIIIIIVIMDLKYANYFKFKENKNRCIV